MKKKRRVTKPVPVSVARELRALSDQLRLVEMRFHDRLTTLTSHVREMNDVPRLLAHIGDLNQKLRAAAPRAAAPRARRGKRGR